MLRRYFGKISPLAITQLTGHNGELVIDETTNELYIMDGETPGGFLLNVGVGQSFQNDLNALNANVANTNANVANTNANVSAINSNISIIYNDISEINGNIIAANAQIVSLQHQISNISVSTNTGNITFNENLISSNLTNQDIFIESYHGVTVDYRNTNDIEALSDILNLIEVSSNGIIFQNSANPRNDIGPSYDYQWLFNSDGSIILPNDAEIKTTATDIEFVTNKQTLKIVSTPTSAGIEFADGTIQTTAFANIVKTPRSFNIDGGGAYAVFEANEEYAEGGMASSRYGTNSQIFNGGSSKNENMDYCLNGGGA